MELTTPITKTEHTPISTASPAYVGFWFRTLAALIDGVLCQITSIAITVPLAFALGASMAESNSITEIESAGSGLGFLIAIFVSWLWSTISESSKWQATIGKRMLGLKVTNENGDRIGFGQANARYWSMLLSALIFGIGFLMVAFTKKKQGLHDKIAGTVVVKANS